MKQLCRELQSRPHVESSHHYDTDLEDIVTIKLRRTVQKRDMVRVAKRLDMKVKTTAPVVEGTTVEHYTHLIPQDQPWYLTLKSGRYKGKRFQRLLVQSLPFTGSLSPAQRVTVHHVIETLIRKKGRN